MTECFVADLEVGQGLAVPCNLLTFTIYPFTIYHLSLWTFGANGDGGLTVGTDVERHFVEEGREEFIDGFADDERVHADAGKDVPGTHGTVVLVHFGAVAARLVHEGAANEWGGVGIVASVAMGDALCGKAADNAASLFGIPSRPKRNGTWMSGSLPWL